MRNALDAYGHSLMKIVLLILVFVYVCVFFWFIWKSAPTCRWYHLVLGSFALLFTIALLPMTAVVLKSRSAWAKQVADLEARAEQLERERSDLTNGVAGDPTRDPGVLELQTNLRRLNAEVGRVFRDLEVRDRGPNGVILGRAVAQPPAVDGIPVDPAAAPPAAPASTDPLAAVDSVVYAFAEQVLQEGGSAVPVFYLGEFRVTQSAADAITITPTVPLEPFQLQSANQANRWAIYEMMPTDNHEAFIAAGSISDDDLLFGRVDEETLRSLFGNSVPAETLNAYLRDGSRATPNDPPQTRWNKIEFLKDYELTVDGQDQRSASDGGFYDAMGQAVDSRLQRPENDVVTFKAGEQLVILESAAQSLINDGTARLIDAYFVRPLVSYRHTLRDLRQQIDYLDREAISLQRQQIVLQAALDLTNEMTTKGQQRKLELEKDEAQVGKELAAIRSFSDNLNGQLVAAKQEMSRLYRENLAHERELERAQAEVRELVEAREAAVSGPSL